MTTYLTRTVAQFFFEVGYAACFAEVMIRNGMKAPFELTDAHIEVAWPRSIEAHEDGAEMDRNLALANAAPDLLAKCERAAKVFRGYAAVHRGKNTEEGEAKAVTNELIAEEIEAVIHKAARAAA